MSRATPRSRTAVLGVLAGLLVASTLLSQTPTSGSHRASRVSGTPRGIVGDVESPHAPSATVPARGVRNTQNVLIRQGEQGVSIVLVYWGQCVEDIIIIRCLYSLFCES